MPPKAGLWQHPSQTCGSRVPGMANGCSDLILGPWKLANYQYLASTLCNQQLHFGPDALRQLRTRQAQLG